MNVFFILLTFVIIITVILMSDSPTAAMAIVSLIANFLIISTRFGDISEGLSAGKSANGDTSADGEPTPQTPQIGQLPQLGQLEDHYVYPRTDIPINLHAEPHIPQYRFTYNVDPDDYHVAPYGPYYENWRAYKTSYSTGYDEPQALVHFSCPEKNYGIDSANTLMAQRRFRDKKSMDGATVKDANYYRYHYSNELDEEENKPWWGRDIL